jgi:hypothetical protein
MATARRTIEVRIVTVFGGDPTSSLPAGLWDRRAGFATAGEAARVRQAEDCRACDIIGATQIVLPFGDRQYERGAEPDVIWASIEESVSGCGAVLVPGFPLAHEDHAWLESLFRARWQGEARVGLYVEQPYATVLARRRAIEVDLSGWTALKSTPADRLRKFAACRAYASQLPLLGGASVVAAVLELEAREGERLQWVAGSRRDGGHARRRSRRSS